MMQLNNPVRYVDANAGGGGGVIGTAIIVISSHAPSLITQTSIDTRTGIFQSFDVAVSSVATGVYTLTAVGAAIWIQHLCAIHVTPLTDGLLFATANCGFLGSGSNTVVTVKLFDASGAPVDLADSDGIMISVDWVE